MSLILVAEFDNEASARSALQHLTMAGVEKSRIDAYPSLETTKVKEPAHEEKVQGAETPLSTNGPLGHLQAIVAKVFGAGRPDTDNVSESEPTTELTGKKPVFLSIHMDGHFEQTPTLEILLNDAGAVRVAQHDQP